MVMHPPMLYMGYVGFSVAFAFAVAALLSGRLDATWGRWSRPWTTAAWGFLTIGIALGSGWAYYELGWGGWWFWDPVENASFMPWLVGTALIHSLAVTEKRGAFRSWTVLLAIAAFALSLLGTFLVRSGVLTSVHAFAVDPKRGIFILLLFAVFLLLRGHNQPGGGFVGGLVVAASFVLYSIAYGVQAARRALPVRPSTLLGVGLLVALVSALPGALVGKAFMTAIWTTVPIALPVWTILPARGSTLAAAAPASWARAGAAIASAISTAMLRTAISGPSRPPAGRSGWRRRRARPARRARSAPGWSGSPAAGPSTSRSRMGSRRGRR